MADLQHQHSSNNKLGGRADQKLMGKANLKYTTLIGRDPASTRWERTNSKKLSSDLHISILEHKHPHLLWD